MDPLEKDEIPMLSAAFSPLDVLDDLPTRSSQFNRTRSASISSMPTTSTKASENEIVLVAHTGPLLGNRRSQLPQSNGPLYVNQKHDILSIAMQSALRLKALDKKAERYPSSRAMNHNSHPSDEHNKTKNEHLLKSGQLGMCNDPYCTTCPSSSAFYMQKKTSKSSLLSDQKAQLHNLLYGDARSWAKRKFGFFYDYIPGVINPHAKAVQQWNQFFVISCLIAIFIDPLFFFLLSVIKDNKCIVLNLPLTKVVVVFRSITDFVYLLHMLLQFKLAYVAPESRVVGAGELVDHPKKIAINYLTGYFFIDFFIVLPLPQIIIMYVLPNYLGSSNAISAKNLLRASVLVQYIPRLYRFSPLVVGQTPSGFIFESAWANFVINLLSFVLSGHVVGSCWYLLGLQRVNQCLRDACRDSGKGWCMKFIDCGHGSDFGSFESVPRWTDWKNNENATACFGQDGFPYGIYAQAVNLTTERSLATRYVYSFFWGFQQISTLAGNQTPSYFVWEVLFTMAIIGLGLLLFALLIGNMQNFLQSLGRRRLELSLRRRDFEQWMSHRRLPEELRRKVRQAERYNWAATRGVNEENLLELLSEDIQKDIRRHLFSLVKKVRIFALLDETILDAICERLRHKTYIGESKIMNHGDLICKMVFIVRGKMESSEDGINVPLSEGDVCGEELLTWCLEHSSVNTGGRKIRIPGPRLLSNRTVKCLTNVEAFTLRAADLEEVTSRFSRFLRNPRVQGAIRYESPYWRGMAAKRIQVAWRYRNKRLRRGHTETPTPNSAFSPNVSSHQKSYVISV